MGNSRESRGEKEGSPSPPVDQEKDRDHVGSHSPQLRMLGGWLTGPLVEDPHMLGPCSAAPGASLKMKSNSTL